MIKLSFLNLFRRKTRTFLALLGVIIGVASIIVLVSIVDGLFLQFNDVINQYKGLNVMEKDAVDQPFSILDEGFANDLERVPGVNVAIPEIWYVPEKIDGKTNEFSFSTASVYGLDIKKQNAARQAGWIVEIDEGKSLSGNDAGFVLIGKKIAEDYRKFAGAKIEINGKKFVVKGIFKGESDLIENIIAMNLSDAKQLSNIPSGKVNSFTLDLDDPARSEQIRQLIEFKFPDEVKVFSAATYSKAFDDALGQFRLLVFFVAAISAVVAGIGIVNTILMSIRDRIKEIGALKAVGWTSGDIVKMVLFESMLIGVIGGIIGIVFGFLLDVLLKSAFGLGFAVTLPLILEAFGFALFLGLAAGIYPAYRASKLEPVVALRGG